MLGRPAVQRLSSKATPHLAKSTTLAPNDPLTISRACVASIQRKKLPPALHALQRYEQQGSGGVHQLQVAAIVQALRKQDVLFFYTALSPTLQRAVDQTAPACILQALAGAGQRKQLLSYCARVLQTPPINARLLEHALHALLDCESVVQAKHLFHSTLVQEWLVDHGRQPESMGLWGAGIQLYATLDDWPGIERIWQHMKSAQGRPSGSTIAHYFAGLDRRRNWEKVIQEYHEMHGLRDAPLDMHPTAHAAALRAYREIRAELGRQRATSILQAQKENRRQYDTAVSILSHAEYLTDAMDVVREGQRRGVYPQATTASGAVKVDLHGATLPVAKIIVRLVLQRMQRSTAQNMVIVVGRGTHSKGKMSTLRPGIQQQLQQLGIPYTIDPDNNGRLRVEKKHILNYIATTP